MTTMKLSVISIMNKGVDAVFNTVICFLCFNTVICFLLKGKAGFSVEISKNKETFFSPSKFTEPSTDSGWGALWTPG